MAANIQNTQLAQPQGALGTVWGYVEPVVEKVPYGWVVVKAVSVVGAVLGLRRAQQQPQAPAPATQPIPEAVIQMTAELQTARREDAVRNERTKAHNERQIAELTRANLEAQERERKAKCQRNACIAVMAVLLTGAGAATTYVATKMSRY